MLTVDDNGAQTPETGMRDARYYRKTEAAEFCKGYPNSQENRCRC